MTHIDYSSVIGKEIAHRPATVSRGVALRAALRNFLDVTFSSHLDQSDKFLLARAQLLLRALAFSKLPSPELLDALASSTERYEAPLLHKSSCALLAAKLAKAPDRDLAHKIIEDAASAFGSIEHRFSALTRPYTKLEKQNAYFKEQHRLLSLSWRDFTPAAQDVFLTPLWLGSHTPDMKGRDEIVFAKYLSTEAYSFWRDWYQGFLNGEPLDWELQRRVALIDDATWDAGPEAVAAAIERIKAEMLSEKLPMAETIELNPETGKFRAVPVEIAKPSLLAATLTRVEDTLEDVLASPSNGLHDRSREVRDLRRAMTKHGNDPQQIEMGFVSAYKSLTRQILNDDLPPSEENLALQDALEEGARGIRATHPDVAENRKIWSEQAIRELSEKAPEQLKEALPELVAISDPDLADDWQHDISRLINDATLPLPTGAPSLPGADEVTRIFSRAAKISLLLKSSEIVHKIDGSAGYKAATIIATVTTLVTLGLSIL